MIKEFSINDNKGYHYIVDIANALGKNVKAMQHGYFPIKNNIYAWCPQIAVLENGKTVSQSKHGWINTLSNDGSEIIETRDDLESMSELKEQSDYLRVTFVKEKNIDYRFVGIFVYDYIKSTKNQRHYYRISKMFEVENVEK